MLLLNAHLCKCFQKRGCFSLPDQVTIQLSEYKITLLFTIFLSRYYFNLEQVDHKFTTFLYCLSRYFWKIGDYVQALSLYAP